jgi:GNAT superfamily N-acetyltransferase
MEGTMAETVKYSAVEAARDGRRIEIRALRTSDHDELLAAVDRTGPESLYRRFFSARRIFSEREVEGFLNVDFIDQVALVAVVEECGQAEIAGGGRYAVIQPGIAEVAFMVVDRYQGKGIGGMLMRHLTAIARRGGLRELVADVLVGNVAMLKVLRESGLHMDVKGEAGIIQVTLRL